MIVEGTLYRFAYSLVNRVARLVARVTVHGAEQMPRGGVLLVSNHLSNYDAFLIGMSFNRPMSFMGKAELFQNPVIAALARGLLAFPIDRNRVDRVALRHAENLLRSGRIVGLFPEGHRSRNGVLQEGQGGMVLLARRTGVPILPIAVVGSQAFLPPAVGRWRPWRRPVCTVSVGPPFTLADLSDDRLDTAALANLAMKRVANLLPPDYRGALGDSSNLV